MVLANAVICDITGVMSANNPYGEILPAVPNYQDPSVPVDEAYTWNVIPPTDEGGIVRVVFSSQLNAETKAASPEKVALLAHYDEVAWGDAKGQEGFLYYRPDEVDETTLFARSFCLWRRATDAEAASQRDEHRRAVAYAMGPGRDVYATYDVRKDRLEQTDHGLIVTRLARMTVRHGNVVDSWKVA